MIIRKMKSSDVAAIAELEKQCFSDPWSAESISSELDNRLSYWLVAGESGKVVGYVGSQSVLDSADMMNIAVAPEYRRLGIGNALIEALVTYLRNKSIRFLLLEVRVSNGNAISLYEKYGYQRYGIREKYYPDGEDAYLMTKTL